MCIQNSLILEAVGELFLERTSLFQALSISSSPPVQPGIEDAIPFRFAA